MPRRPINIFLLLAQQLESREAKKILGLMLANYYRQTGSRPGCRFDKKF